MVGPGGLGWVAVATGSCERGTKVLVCVHCGVYFDSGE